MQVFISTVGNRQQQITKSNIYDWLTTILVWTIWINLNLNNLNDFETVFKNITAMLLFENYLGQRFETVLNGIFHNADYIQTR